MSSQARREARAEFATRAFIVLLLVLLGGALVTIAQIRHTQQSTAPLVEKIDKTSRRIRSCTTPKKPCYERGRAQTAKAVGDIGRYVVLSAACAAVVPPEMPVDQRIATITDCVMKRLSH